MPKSLVSKKKMFRDFSFKNDKYLGYNYLKNIRSVRDSFCETSEVSQSHLEFMLWCYDLEFFTIDYASNDYGMNKVNLSNRIIYPLLKQGYLYKHFDKLTPSKDHDDQLFREETKYNYRVRYALSQRGRLLVQRFYNSLH